ncbi:MAG TPA: glycosyltransferase [Longimicrobiales bacterium]|nr:glycosyltransferase [Longimicrobiales bacterium]
MRPRQREPEWCVSRFVEPLQAGYDVVVGTRRNGSIAPDAMRKRHRHFLEPVQTALSRRFFRFHVSDVRCGFRSIRREALEIRQGHVPQLAQLLLYEFLRWAGFHVGRLGRPGRGPSTVGWSARGGRRGSPS